MTYRYFELGKNADPEREDGAQFKSAFTVHPVSEPNLMYRLHKRFSQIELEWTYLQIQQLQVRGVGRVGGGAVLCSNRNRGSNELKSNIALKDNERQFVQRVQQMLAYP